MPPLLNPSYKCISLFSLVPETKGVENFQDGFVGLLRGEELQPTANATENNFCN